VLPTAQLRQNAGLLNPFIKPLEQTLKALVLAPHYFGQTASASFQTIILAYAYLPEKPGFKLHPSNNQTHHTFYSVKIILSRKKF
jgi:hypothetical protein